MATMQLWKSGRELACRTSFEARDVSMNAQGVKRWDATSGAWMFADASDSKIHDLYVRAMEAGVQFVDESEDKSITAAVEMVEERQRKLNAVKDGRELPRPNIVSFPPRNHQLVGFAMIDALPGSCLAHDMGTGKTYTLILAAMNLNMKRILIVCPSRVIPVWEAQLRIHCQVPYVAACYGGDVGTIAKRTDLIKQRFREAEVGGRMFFCAVNYEAIWRPPLDAWIAAQSWDLIGADECHKLCDAQTKVSKFMFKIRTKAKRRVGASGTPTGQDPLGVFGVCKFLDPGIFGTSYTAFRARYARMGGYQNHQVIGYQNLDELNRKFFQISHRVKKSDVLDLPPTTQVDVPVELSKEEKRIYDAMDKELIADIGAGIVTAANAMVRILRLQQITGGCVAVSQDPRRADYDPMNSEAKIERFGRSKIETLVELIGQLPEGEPIVVFAQFTADIEAIRIAAEECGREAVELSGRINEIGANWKPGVRLKRERGQTIEVPAPKATVAAVQIQAGGAGIDLTAACYGAYFSPGCSLLNFDQSLARLDRQGQTRPVTYYFLQAIGTVDRRIYRALANHRDVVEAVLTEIREGLGIEGKTNHVEQASR